MNKVAIRASAASVPYSGAKTAPDYSLTYGKQALSSDQYTVTFSGDQITPGKQSVTFSGTGKEKNGVRFTGSKTVSYKISGKYDLSGEETIVRLCDPESGQQGTSFPYTRGGTKPVVAVAYKGTALRQGRDFSVAYSDHKMPGTAKVTIKGKRLCRIDKAQPRLPYIWNFPIVVFRLSIPLNTSLVSTEASSVAEVMP